MHGVNEQTDNISVQNLRAPVHRCTIGPSEMQLLHPVELAGLTIYYRIELYKLVTQISGPCFTCSPHLDGGFAESNW